MQADTRLNLLLTPPAGTATQAGSQPWHQTMSRLLLPLGVRTFEANNGTQAMELIEKVPIHLAVVDTRLPAISGLSVLQLIQRLRDQGIRAAQVPEASPPKGAGASPGGFRFEMKVEEQHHQGQTQRRIEVRFDSRPAEPHSPVVILIAPPPGGGQQDRALLQEALKFNAFSVLAEPVDVNLALEVMARAMKRFHQNQWPV
jgi:CheY-like chemotaxis protein